MSASTFEPTQTVEATAGGSEKMSEHFVKPGNLDRGWNDPPVFAFCTQNSTRRGGTPLTKRVPPPQLTGGTTSTITSPQVSLTPASAPPSSVAPPPSVTPPLAPPTAESSASVTQEEPSVEVVLETLTSLLTGCRGHVQGRICDDIGRKLELLRDAWNSGKLSDLVKRRLGMLANDLRASAWTESERRVVSLTVDHTSEVGPFMAAVRRLLSEARSLSLQQKQQQLQEPPMESCRQQETQPLQAPQQTEQSLPLPPSEQDPVDPDPKLDLPSEQHLEQPQSEYEPLQEQTHSQPEPIVQQLERVQLDQLPLEQQLEQACPEQPQPEQHRCDSEPLPEPEMEVELEEKPKL
uniref:Steroid receptor RNA activator 1 n=1 Tax=Petromyzon marinus TaxID=7757 RepID=A0AAJ7UBA8_PETMA|nr:steroid receptor RNA activator 1 [Petromyzon marinus]